MDDNNVHVRYAGFWIRFVASLLDTFILALPILLIIYFISGGEYFDISAYKKLMIQAQHGDVNALQNMPKTSMHWEIVFEVSMAVIIIAFWKKWMGATPGKKMVGITVVDAKTFAPMNNKQAITRYIGYIASTIPLLFGFFMVAFRQDKKALHDILADSVVIYTSHNNM